MAPAAPVVKKSSDVFSSLWEEVDTETGRKTFAKSVRDVRELFADDELKSYHIGVESRSPIQNLVVYGVSFERRKGTYDANARNFSYAEGRLVELPERLVEAIQERLKWMFIDARYLLTDDEEGNKVLLITEVRETIDLFSLPLDQAKKRLAKINTEPTDRKKNGSYRKLTCLAELLYVKPVSGLSQVHDAQTLQEQIDRLQAHNARLELQLKDK